MDLSDFHGPIPEEVLVRSRLIGWEAKFSPRAWDPYAMRYACRPVDQTVWRPTARWAIRSAHRKRGSRERAWQRQEGRGPWAWRPPKSEAN